MTPGNPSERETGETGSRGAPEDVSIELTVAQVNEVVRAITGEAGVQEWLLGSLSAARLQGDAAWVEMTETPQLSQSFLRGLSILRALLPVGTEKGIHQLADELDMSPSTTHRYATTLTYARLVEQNPDTRVYRLAAGGTSAPDDAA
jgi:hypothetical protein